MATGTAPFSGLPGNFRGRLELWLISQNIAANQSTVGIQAWVDEISHFGAWDSEAEPWNANCNGVGYSGGWTYDFRPGGLQSVLLLNTSQVITHNADGTSSISMSSNMYDTDNYLGTSSPSVGLALPRIPRGPRVKDDGGIYRNTIAYVKDTTYKIAIPYVKDTTYKIGGS